VLAVLAFTILGLTAGVTAIALLIAAVILAFEIWMFVDAIQNKHISTDRKILWCVGMALLHPFVAIAYYFTDHKTRA
jgi:hypothetical protein